MPPALTDHTTWPILGLIYYWMYTKHCHELRHARKAWPGTLYIVDPYLLSGPISDFVQFVNIYSKLLLSKRSRNIFTVRDYCRYKLLPLTVSWMVCEVWGVEETWHSYSPESDTCGDLQTLRIEKERSSLLLCNFTGVGGLCRPQGADSPPPFRPRLVVFIWTSKIPSSPLGYTLYMYACILTPRRVCFQYFS